MEEKNMAAENVVIMAWIMGRLNLLGFKGLSGRQKQIEIKK